MQRTHRVALHSCKIRFVAQKPGNPAYPQELETLGDHLRKVRLDRGMTQRHVAEVLNVQPDSVTGWEMNRHMPTAKMAKRIIDFLGYHPLAKDNDNLGRLLRNARLSLGHSLSQAALRMECDPSTLGSVERCKRTPSVRTIEKTKEYILLARY